MYILLLKYCNIRYVFFILCGNKDYYYYYYYYYYNYYYYYYWKVKELDVSLRKKLIWYPVLILEFPAMILKSLFYLILLGY